jgi:pyrroloquinoline-quinone synthase
MGTLRSKDVVQELDALVERWHLLQHPFYQAWSTGQVERWRLQLYAGEYYAHVKAFPSHLRAVAERADGELRALVLENLAEEEAPGRTHPQLWREFAAALGVDEQALDKTPVLPGMKALVETYRRICRQEPLAAAVAALYVYEAQVPETATQKIDGLRRWYGVRDPKALAYFSVHEEADVRHRAAWSQWLSQQPSVDADAVLAAASDALKALWSGLDSINAAAAPVPTA